MEIQRVLAGESPWALQTAEVLMMGLEMGLEPLMSCEGPWAALAGKWSVSLMRHLGWSRAVAGVE